MHGRCRQAGQIYRADSTIRAPAPTLWVKTPRHGVIIADMTEPAALRVPSPPSVARRHVVGPAAYGVLRLRRDRHHRRDVRHLHPLPVRDQAAPCAPSVHRFHRQGASGGARDQPYGRGRGTQAHRLRDARQRRDPGGRQGTVAWSRDGHVQHLHRAARGRVRHHLEPPDRPFRGRVGQSGIHRPDRIDQLRPRPRRRPIDQEPRGRPT